MAKTKEELSELRNEYEALNAKLKKLDDDEFKQITGGDNNTIYIRDLEAIAPYATDSSFEHSDWKSNNDIPSEPGNYKIG